MYERKFMTGTTTNTFSPSSQLTRWQIATILTRMLELDTANIAEEDKAPFTDISTLPLQRQNEIHALYKAGLIKGQTATTFNPYANIKRSHFALLVNNVFTTNFFMPTAMTELPFSDVKYLPQAEKEAIWSMYEKGIINGYPNGTFKPAGTTTRAEAAKIFSVFSPYLGLQQNAR